MASGKRASMREGPLADLFRKTEAAAEQAENSTPPTQDADASRVPAPSTPAAQERRAKGYRDDDQGLKVSSHASSLRRPPARCERRRATFP